MSADSWARCPRCVANGTHAPGDRTTFREDWELGLNDAESWGEGEENKPACVILNYHGECQICGLKVEIRERYPIPGLEPERNKPTGFVTRKNWGAIPVGWFVRHPKDPAVWFEVKRTTADEEYQNVFMATLDGRTLEVRRPHDERVPCRRGTAPGTPEISAGLEALGEGARILKDEV